MRDIQRRRFRSGRMFLKILFIPILFFGLAYVVMRLWNWLLPDIFGLKEIDYWHALGLFLLSHLLFKSGGFGGGHPHSHRRREWRRRLKEKVGIERAKAKLQARLDRLNQELGE